MNHIQRTANRYYLAFESYQGVLSKHYLLVLLFVTCGLASLYSFLCTIPLELPLAKYESISANLYVASTLIFELFAILIWVRIDLAKEKYTIQRVNKSLNTSLNSLPELKALWFKQVIGIKNSQYLSIAIDLDNYLTLRERHDLVLSLTGRKFLQLVVSSDSKNRLLAIFMGCSATMVALCIAAGININYLFEIFDLNYFFNLITAVVFISVSVFGLFIIGRYFILLSFLWMENYSVKVDDFSKRRIKILINQFLDLHVIEKVKMKSGS